MVVKPVASMAAKRLDQSSSSSLLSGASTGRLKNMTIILLFVVGITVCVTSLICIILLPAFVTNQIAKRLVLKNNSLLLDRWSKPNVPMFFKVWVFDVTNAQQVSEKRGIKPELKEIGPFVFRLKRQKDVISFAGDNLYYTERKIYHFSPELSCCAINTTVTIPNIPLVGVVDRVLSYNLPLVGRFLPRIINRAVQSLREQLFVRRQVREILFEGYDVELLKVISRVGSFVGLPQPQQRFAILKGRNDTWRPEQDGVFAINTGARDRKQFGRVSSWNSHKVLPFWAAPACNQINGSDGTLFPPPINKHEPLYIFNQELCRTVNLVYDRASDIRAISAYRFVLNPLNFAHTMPTTSSARKRRPLQLNVLEPSAPRPSQLTGWPDDLSRQESETRPIQDVASKMANQEANKLVREAQLNDERHPPSESPRNLFTCFCDRKSTNLNGVNVCQFDGLIDLSKCSKQAQVIFGSMPHFYQSDSRLLRQVVGLEPNGSKHTTYLDIEPNTGLVLGGKRRVQLNILIKHNKEVEGFENINDLMVPVVWFEESAMIPEESANKFRSLYTNRIRVVNIVLRSMLLAAIGLLAIDLHLLARQYWPQQSLNMCSTSSHEPKWQTRVSPGQQQAGKPEYSSPLLKSVRPSQIGELSPPETCLKGPTNTLWPGPGARLSQEESPPQVSPADRAQ